MTTIPISRAGDHYRVDTPSMSLVLHADPKLHGITSLHVPGDDRELVHERLFLLNVYRLLCTGRLMAIARDEPFDAALEDGTLWIRWRPTEAHPVRLTAAFTVSAPDTIDVEYTVTAEQDVTDYEVLTSSYFDYSLEPYAVVPAGRPAGVRSGRSGPDDLRLFRLEHSPFLQGNYVLLGRDLDAVRTRLDGRYNNTAGHPAANFASGPFYGRPIGIMGNERMHVLQLAQRDACASLSTTYVDTQAPRGEPKDGIARHNAIYVGFWANDISAGETRTTRLRQVIRPGPPTLDGILAQYEVFAASVSSV